MRFQITMNMPARSGNSVHQIIADHPASDLHAFVDVISNTDFVIVNELYKDDTLPRSHSQYYSSQGELALNPLFIGKIKVLK